MKILLDGHMLGQNQSGIERYWKNLAENLQKKNNVELILYSNQKKKYLSNFKQLSFFTPAIRNGLYRVLFGFSSAENIFEPDLIHVSNFTPFIKKSPVVTTVHDLGFKNSPQNFSLLSKIIFNLFFKRSLDNSDAIICVSDRIRQELIKSYPKMINKTTVIYEAPDPVFNFIANKKNVIDFLEKNFELKDKYFLVVGDIRPRKNPIPVIKAFLSLEKKYPDIKLVLVGKNLMKNSLKNKYPNLIRSKKIIFTGYVSDAELNYLYNGALALIFNSVYEGFGLPILEAMACKTPVICSNIPVFREIASDAVLFVKKKSDIYKLMEKVLTSSDLRQKYEDLGLERSKSFSWAESSERTIQIYKKVLFVRPKPVIPLIDY